MHQSSGRWRLGLALSLLTVFLWGILPIALAINLQVLDVYTIIWFRFLMSFALLAAFLGVRGKLPNSQQLRSSSGQLLAIATLFLALNYFLFMQGLALTSPANAEVLIQLAPLLLSFGGLAIFQERYTLRQWIGVSILTSGYIVFFGEQLRNLITAQSTYVFGSALIVLGAAAWAIYALSQKQLLQSLSSAHIMLIIYGGCALLFTPFAKPQAILTLNSFHLVTLLFCAFNTLIAYGAFAESLEHWEASRVSAVLALAPIITLASVALVSVFLPSLIPTEHLTLIGILGAFLVVAGSVSITLGKAD
ncbi:DMT family transporter [Nodularia sphaerocarpa]|uniref:DMT family transporter n=1 Tax=Nodularia sphaerocarpa TaxID=137816 RepID=UPI001EFA6D4C|nr:DMT family transporter [Nodularia sphaerocarpa]MDB9372270.1 DMT family transporter [Nodularia sphaerocarpa CS-585]MDB9378265.1 DMT family transporter [Nodularia sphaerocarpa CS-585A2]ULP74562.1 putative inner membrane transporter YhbE [Nodularia sphaerocarpa UHCC 0038]